LGDGVYVNFNGYALELTTENGIAITNTIVLEPEVWTALKQYAERYEHPSPLRLSHHAEGRALGLYVNEEIEEHLKVCTTCREIVETHAGWVERLPQTPKNK
jgi:hypothetical protein